SWSRPACRRRNSCGRAGAGSSPCRRKSPCRRRLCKGTRLARGADRLLFLGGPRLERYNLIMSRWLAALFLSVSCGFCQQPPKKQEPPKQEEQIPPEEDEATAPKVYSFNPLQAEKELKIGNYYFRKGSFRAAAQRFREAT